MPVWSNVTGQKHVWNAGGNAGNAELLKRRLVEQLVSPVRWAEICQSLAAGGILEGVELAPGTVLKGLMRRIDRNIKVTSHDEP
jgi:[acyl-carrier-protein] S-malonyltransferase